MNTAIDQRAHILSRLFENYWVWKALVDEQGIEVLDLKQYGEFNFFDTMRHVELLSAEQQKAIEFLRLGIEDKELKKLGLGIASEVSRHRQEALQQLAYWSLDEEAEDV